MSVQHRVTVLAALVLVAVTAACGGSAGTAEPSATGEPSVPANSSGTGQPSVALSRTQEYQPGRAADIYLPGPGRRPAAVVVLVPGGGWQTADRTGLAALAARLARAGMVVANITYRTGEDHVTFPAPVEDIACATAFAETVARAGAARVPVVLLGHSSGAQLAAVVALSGNRYQRGCPYPGTAVDGLIGVSGPYDVRAFADVAVALFGATPEQDPAAWRDGDPLRWAARGASGLRVLLLHGDQDTLVPPDQSRQFAAGLEKAGVPVTLRLVTGADHLTVFQPSNIGGAVTAWIGGLTSDVS